ncbi:transcription elongation factor TFIIS-like [Phalaenopsis equestris]|uniref:transcription elongation factor TFIIS-like n=1 Tax=Phalaenopsis equestris TaxID=78828 RepID=UPI0009E5C117|nr:transcription elongation factor TFIIS-like [Phalaenopsis equestris]
MEKELLGAFDAAEKAAEAAAAGGGLAEEDRCVDALKRLRRMDVTTKDLVNTQVGKRIRSLTKHPKSRIQIVATDLFKFWKNVVIEETSKDGKKSSSSNEITLTKTETKSERSDATKIEKNSKSTDARYLRKFIGISRSDAIKIEKTMKDESASLSYERCNKIETIKVERFSKEEKQTSFSKNPSIPTGPPKLTAMVKCNDPVRDKLRELLAEAFVKVSEEASEDLRDEVRDVVDEINICDPIRVAVTVESAMFEKLGRSNGAQKVKYRSIMFNLKDSKNTDLRRRVLLGHIPPERLITMTAEEMASDERKTTNKQVQEKALFNSERGGPPKATTDQFRCGRCGQRKCTYYQLQTKSADEPTTTFVTCVNCNNHWKFC